MRAVLLASISLCLVAATFQTTLPTPLAKHLETLRDAGSLTVTYTVQPLGSVKSSYKLVLSKPGVFMLTTPTGVVESDGKMVTTYVSAKKKYTEEPLTDAWLAKFSARPEMVAWGSFLLKKPADVFASATLGKARNLGGKETTEVEVAIKKGPSATLYVDNAMNLARGASVREKDQEFLVLAQNIELTKDALPMTKFAFVPPAGAEKEEMVAKAEFADVQALLVDKCLPCHNETNARSNVIVTNYQGISKIVVPGEPAQSQLIKSVKARGPQQMPKNRAPLSDDEVKLLETWITNGAKQ